MFGNSLCSCYTASNKQNNLSPDQSPNPFSPILNIPVVVEKKQFVVLKLCDPQGKEIATLFQDTVATGKWVITANTTPFLGGEYIIKYELQDSTYQKKCEILK